MHVSWGLGGWGGGAGVNDVQLMHILACGSSSWFSHGPVLFMMVAVMGMFAAWMVMVLLVLICSHAGRACVVVLRHAGVAVDECSAWVVEDLCGACLVGRSFAFLPCKAYSSQWKHCSRQKDLWRMIGDVMFHCDTHNTTSKERAVTTWSKTLAATSFNPEALSGTGAGPPKRCFSESNLHLFKSRIPRPGQHFSTGSLSKMHCYSS